MEQYHTTVKQILLDGVYKPNRTAADTIATFGTHYTIDVDFDRFPLLTTKDLLGFRWNSLVEEFFWFLSGEEHIRNLREKTKLWNAWADEEGRLDTAYGRFWRRYPIPEDSAHLDGESWTDSQTQQYVNAEEISSDDFVNEYDAPESTDETRYTFDQIEYVIDQLKNNPNTRRMVVTAWHPANAAESTLPPCHYTFVVNVQNGKLNLHLTQRSGDTALGVPFNIAGYSMLLLMLAQETEFEPGEFSHTIVDSHIYCGTKSRGEWYGKNLDRLKGHIKRAEFYAKTAARRQIRTLQKYNPVSDAIYTYSDVADWIEKEAPPEADGDEDMDHIPGLLRQLDRDPRDLPHIKIPEKQLANLTPEDIEITNYDPYDGIHFGVAE